MSDSALPSIPPSPAPGDAARRSTAIAIARLIGIVGVVYVHAWTGRDADVLAARPITDQVLLFSALGELFGRSAVPLLGMISGWLVASTVRRQDYASFVRGKARTIVLPMLAWNAIAILTVGAAAHFGHLRAPALPGLGWALNELVPVLHPDDINVQMPFLRDLFVCMLAAPLLVRLPAPALAGVALAAFVWSVSGWSFPLLLRPSILLFFVCGMAARRGGIADRVAAMPMIACALPYLLMLGPRLWLVVLGDAFQLAHPHAIAAFDILFRFASAMFFWRLAWTLAASRAGDRLRATERYGFLVFCDHLVLIWLLGPVIGHLTGPLGAPLYPAFFLLQPLLALGATMLIGRMLTALSPALARLLSGGRLGRMPDMTTGGTAETVPPASPSTTIRASRSVPARS